MKRSRWIYFPLAMGSFYVLGQYLFGSIEDLTDFIVSFIIWTASGFLTLYMSKTQAENSTKSSEDNIYDYRQNRKFTVLMNEIDTYELCKLALLTRKKTTIINEGVEKGKIVAKISDGFRVSDRIEISLRVLSLNLTEVLIDYRCISPAAVIGDGKTWNYVESLCEYIKNSDAAKNKKVLRESLDLAEEIYSTRNEKEKIKSQRDKRK